MDEVDNDMEILRVLLKNTMYMFFEICVGGIADNWNKFSWFDSSKAMRPKDLLNTIELIVNAVACTSDRIDEFEVICNNQLQPK